ncbi:MAG: universal stress protein [Thiogranum sp.]|jgi:nucleotide-binding universal stress UspA family protein
MGIKIILVPVDGGKSSFKALDRAFIIADRFGAHIKALHVMTRASDVAVTGLYNVPAKLRKDVEQKSDAAVMERAAELQQQFEALCLERDIPISKQPAKQGGATAFWHQEFGHIDEVLTHHGRASDVIAVPRPKIKTGIVRRSPMGQAIEAILLRTGRPVVITPPKCTVGKCERVAIGWNDSVECSRALAMTMPWLVEMKQITVLVTKKRKQAVKELVEYLAWYDVKADIVLLDDKGKSVGEAMLNVCAEISADFLVVGGFSHARARELLFGGVTRHLLMHANIVTIMAH